MQRMMFEFELQRQNDPKERANDLCYEAMDMRDPNQKIATANKALRIDPQNGNLMKSNWAVKI